MPLVTRQANQGNIFNTPNEPGDWLNGDLWVDSDNSQLFVNLAGTALQIGAGTLNQGDVLFSDVDEGLAALAAGTEGQALVMGATVPAWGDAGTWEILDNHIATGTESTFTFTPGSALSNTEFSKIVIVFQGSSTASFNLEMVINSITSSNSWRGVRLTGSANTAFEVTSAAHVQIISTTINDSASQIFATIEIYMPNGAGEDIVGFSTSGARAIAHRELGEFIVPESQTDIDSINFQTSTSTWAIGTQIITYGVRI